MKNKIIKENGFTMTELVVTVALIGTLLSFAVPRYTTVTEEMQAERNIANMQTIREVFFHYFYRMHQQKGRISHFPPTLIKIRPWTIPGLVLPWIQLYPLWRQIIFFREGSS